jgi:hypothetical protein
VATTEVAHPLTMLTAQAATAVPALGSLADEPVLARAVDASRGMLVVCVSAIVGIGPVGARRMIRVRDSSDGSDEMGSDGSGGGAWGSLGAVT